MKRPGKNIYICTYTHTYTYTYKYIYTHISLSLSLSIVVTKRRFSSFFTDRRASRVRKLSASKGAYVYVYMRVCIRKRIREKERERVTERKREGVCVYVWFLSHIYTHATYTYISTKSTQEDIFWCECTHTWTRQ